MTRRFYAAALLVPALACASKPSSTNQPASAPAPRSADRITEQELADPLVAHGDALEAVRRLRPRFLVGRGAVSTSSASAGSVRISINGGPLMPVGNLSRFRAGEILEMRYLNATDATQRFGTSSNGGGVILVTSK